MKIITIIIHTFLYRRKIVTSEAVAEITSIIVSHYEPGETGEF